MLELLLALENALEMCTRSVLDDLIRSWGDVAATPAALAEAATAHAHGQSHPAVSALGVSHVHQLFSSQAHPVLSGCAALRALAGLRLLPRCGS